MQTKNAKLHAECEENAKLVVFLQDEIVNWKKHVKEMKGSSVDTEAKFQELKKQRDVFEQELEETKKLITSLQESEKSWQEKCEQLECDKAKVVESESSLHRAEEQQAQVINGYKKQVTELQEELLNLKQSKDQLQDSLLTCKDDSGELQQTITEYKTTIAELRAKIESLQEDNTTMVQKHQLEIDNVKKQGDEHKRKIKELEKLVESKPSKPKVDRVLSLLSQDSTDSQDTGSSHNQELESVKEQHTKELADLAANYESVVDGLKQECHEMKQQLEKLALELSATPSRVEPKQFAVLTDEVRSYIHG